MKSRLLIVLSLATFFGVVFAVLYLQRNRHEVVCLGNLKAIAVYLHEYLLFPTRSFPLIIV